MCTYMYVSDWQLLHRSNGMYIHRTQHGREIKRNTLDTVAHHTSSSFSSSAQIHRTGNKIYKNLFKFKN